MGRPLTRTSIERLSGGRKGKDGREQNLYYPSPLHVYNLVISVHPFGSTLDAVVQLRNLRNVLKLLIHGVKRRRPAALPRFAREEVER